MNTETIAFRFTEDELSTLCLLLNLDTPNELELKPLTQEGYEKAIKQLSEAGMLIDLGENRLCVSRTIAFMVQSMVKPLTFLVLQSKDRRSILYRCSAMYVLAEKRTIRGFSITPIETGEQAVQLFMETLEIHQSPAILQNGLPLHQGETEQLTHPLEDLLKKFIS